MSSIEAVLDDKATPDEQTVTEADLDSLEFELDEQFDSAESPMEATQTSEELDMSAIEQMLDIEGQPIEGQEPEETTLDGLVLDTPAEAEAEKTDEAPEEEIDPLQDEVTERINEELDFSDIEKLLEQEASAPTDGDKAVEAADEAEFELDLDLESLTADDEAPAEKRDRKDIDEPESLDFADLEEMLEQDDDAEASDSDITDDDLEFELDFEDIGEEKEKTGSVTKTATVELDFADRVTAREKTEAKATQGEATEVTSIEKVAPSDALDEIDEIRIDTKKKFKPIKRRRGVGSYIAWLLTLAILGAGGYGGYLYMQKPAEFQSLIKQIPYIDQIPYLNQIVKPAVKDPGNLFINTIDISSRFYDNKEAGRLFVITGRVKNEYDHPRSHIAIVGELLSKGRKVLMSESVFCGNVLTAKELQSLSLTEIKKRLKIKTGDKRSNVKLKSGGELPFMVVFSSLPKNLDEFTVKVARSTK